MKRKQYQLCSVVDQNAPGYRAYRRLLTGALVMGILGILVCQIAIYRQAIPEQVQLVRGEQTQFDFHVPATADICQASDRESDSASSSDSQTMEAMAKAKTGSAVVSTVALSAPFTLTCQDDLEYVMKVKLFGWFPLKEMKVSAVSRETVIPGGEAVGIYVETDGVLVLGTTAVTDANGRVQNPAENIVAKGDYITAVNGTAIHYKSQLLESIKQSRTSPLVLTLRRNKQNIKVRVTPVETKKGKEYKCGIWVRDDTQGIGTLTYIGEDGSFGALGHGVSDVDTGELLQSGKGRIYEAQISYILEGENGSPGELVGSIDYSDQYLLGSIDDNTACGIFGTGGKTLLSYASGQALPVGYKQEVETGKAYIQSCVSGEKKTYEIQIEKVNIGAGADSPNMVIRVTDKELLRLTGGIVQGMSGSPIIQNGKVIGAVTHVFVNDPTKGYGIFLETMLKS